MANRAALFLLFTTLFFWGLNCSAQQSDTFALQEVNITSYFRSQPIIRTPSSVAVLDSADFSLHHAQSLVPAMNTIPGVRMEERSPGSYRLSIRGSLLRSPFGIRNVKVYVNNLPLTDAGGNTYLNLIDPIAVQRAEILKGPDGSLFGANSGGVVHFNLADTAGDNSALGLQAGSFGMLHFNASSMLRFGKNKLILKEGWTTAEGYRLHSAMQRQYFQVSDHWNYTDGMMLSVLFFQSDLQYQTPGGLTREQMVINPRSARPATATLPGAIEQNAGVHNQTYFGGITHDAEIISDFLFHSVSVFGSVAEFENPFLTNYEFRGEKTGGVRTSLHSPIITDSLFRLNAWIGFEGQKTLAQIDNFQNLGGNPGYLVISGDVNAIQYFGFARVLADLGNKFMIELAASYNVYAVEYVPVYPSLGESARRNFRPQLMPKIAGSWKFAEAMSMRLSVARGYSPPTIAEIRSSDNEINTTLQPESGWNYELGMRIEDVHQIIRWDWSMFYYRLNNAIVRRLNESGEEFFINSGGTVQPGFESKVEWHALANADVLFLNEIIVRSFYTYTAFRFSEYSVDTNDYSGKRLTGVPEHVLGTSAEFLFPFRISLFVQHTYVSAIPLNDANEEFAGEYHLLEARITWQPTIFSVRVSLFAGADNLLDEMYSLGNDLNVAGGRYYNPAPSRNFYGGLNVFF